MKILELNAMQKFTTLITKGKETEHKLAKETEC